MSRDGVRWLDYRKTLKPRYAIVWLDIAWCYLFLAVGVAAVPIAKALWGEWLAVTLALPAAAWIGYWLHSLFLFGHEAAHSNLAPRRKINDRLGDWLVWVFFGSTTANYRHTHMRHHAHLGDHEDTETTYHLCLSVANMVKAVTGIHVLEVLIHKRRLSRTGRAPRKSSRTTNGVLASVRSVALHGVIVGLLLAGGWYAGALAWVLGVGGVFPLCAALRTIVEHRHLDASCDIDFMVERHGPLNRLFGTGFVSRTFGSAGFNQHLLHHWDPAISYTCFESMERFLKNTSLAAEMEASRTSYAAAFMRLMVEARRG